MTKSNQTANEARLKARRTSLGKKSNEELINIILRKDKTERNQSTKINSLTELLNEANALNEEKATCILGFNKYMEKTQEIVKAKQELIDTLISDKNSLEAEKNKYCKEVVCLKALCNLRRKVIFTLFSITTILIILLIVLG